MKSNFKKLAQITVIEFSLLALIFSGIFIYISVSPNEKSNSYFSYNLETYLSTISKTDNFRKNVVLENLSNLSLTQNWTQTLDELNVTLNDFELIVTNGTVSKTITQCTSKNGKFFKSVFISSYNLTKFNPKTLILGVCY
jgi:hypothetical protein